MGGLGQGPFLRVMETFAGWVFWDCREYSMPIGKILAAIGGAGGSYGRGHFSRLTRHTQMLPYINRLLRVKPSFLARYPKTAKKLD